MHINHEDTSDIQVVSPRLCSRATLLISSFSGDIPTVIAFATAQEIDINGVRIFLLKIDNRAA